jgi:hypothetical protein
MSTLVVQIVLKQWDKAERSAEHVEARAAQPVRYPVKSPDAQYLFDHKVVIDQHGDNIMKNRLRYELTDDNKFIIDRFGFDLSSKAVVHFPQPDSMLPPSHIATLDNGWIQCQYEWRYKVFEGGMHYWLYEQFILNAAMVDNLTEDLFVGSEPTHVITL